MNATPNIHRFEDSGEAYDASQTHDEIKDGDVLSVPSEGVVGVLLEAWPVAITEHSGQFHALSIDFDWSAVRRTDDSLKDYSASYKTASEELDRIAGGGS